MTAVNDRPEWMALQAHWKETADLHMRELFAADPQRFERFSLRLDDLLGPRERRSQSHPQEQQIATFRHGVHLLPRTWAVGFSGGAPRRQNTSRSISSR